MMTPADRRYLLAAEGWLELGDWQSANDELDQIQPPLRAHPDVLKMRVEISSVAGNWHHVVEVAGTLAREFPDDPFGHVRLAYALHELKRTAEAFDALSPVVARFPKDWVIPYNLACYTAQLGRIAEARDWLDRALKISDQPTLTRLEAMDDPDLAPLWKEDKKSKTG